MTDSKLPSVLYSAVGSLSMERSLKLAIELLEIADFDEGIDLLRDTAIDDLNTMLSSLDRG